MTRDRRVSARPTAGRRTRLGLAPAAAAAVAAAAAAFGLCLLPPVSPGRAYAAAVPGPAVDAAQASPSAAEAMTLAPTGGRTELALLDVAAGLDRALAAAVAPVASPIPASVGPAALNAPMISGLPFRSGAKFGECMAAMRGRPLDVNSTFIGHVDFPTMVRQSGNDWAIAEARKAPLWLVSLPLLPSRNRQQFSQCASGAFDGYWRAIGAGLRSTGAKHIIIRLGWEANIGSDSHPWGVDSAGQYPAYKACWRRAAQLLKAAAPGTAVEWPNAKKSTGIPTSPLMMYPGDDVVDLWGVHYYDSGPQKNTQALWNQYYNVTYNGGPWGIGAWLSAAKAHGKKLGVGEWGIWQQGASAAQADDPVYMTNMFLFFKNNAASIAYETYLNSQDVHTLCPSTRFPKSAAVYRALWGR